MLLGNEGGSRQVDDKGDEGSGDGVQATRLQGRKGSMARRVRLPSILGATIIWLR